MSSRACQPDQQNPQREGPKADEATLIQTQAGQQTQGILDTTRGQCKHQPLDRKHQPKGQKDLAHGLAGASAGAGAAVVGPTEAPLGRPASDRR